MAKKTTRRSTQERSKILDSIHTARAKGVPLPKALKAAGISAPTYYVWKRGRAKRGKRAGKERQLGAMGALEMKGKLVCFVGTVEQVIEALRELKG